MVAETGQRKHFCLAYVADLDLTLVRMIFGFIHSSDALPLNLTYISESRLLRPFNLIPYMN